MSRDTQDPQDPDRPQTPQSRAAQLEQRAEDYCDRQLSVTLALLAVCARLEALEQTLAVKLENIGADLSDLRR